MSEGKSSELIYTCCAGCETIYVAESDLDIGDREYCRKCVEAGYGNGGGIGSEKHELESDDDDLVPHPHILGWWVSRNPSFLSSQDKKGVII